ncbi:MAG: hypothetical protein IKA04_02765 [Alistipes sp.]|nr:hypothetical protein [Alistipes sp.]
MTTKFRLLTIAIISAIFSVQCTTDKSDTPTIPTSVEDYFRAETFTHNGFTLAYQESTIAPSSAGKAALVVVLHGQYANGSDNKSQIRTDALIQTWHYLSTNNVKAVLVAPQCPTSRSWDEVSNGTGNSMIQVVKAFVDSYSTKANISPSHIYILGYADGPKSSGAGGVWRLLSTYTDTFAAGMCVAAEPDESIVAANVAKTPVLSVKGEMNSYAVALTLDSFADEVRDYGGVIREEVLPVRSRGDVCRMAFSKELLDWVFQYSKNR